MSAYVSFRCTACGAKLRAAIRLVGKARTCPACRQPIVMQPVAPPPADPIMIFEDIPVPAQGHPGWSIRV